MSSSTCSWVTYTTTLNRYTSYLELEFKMIIKLHDYILQLTSSLNVTYSFCLKLLIKKLLNNFKSWISNIIIHHYLHYLSEYLKNLNIWMITWWFYIVTYGYMERQLTDASCLLKSYWVEVISSNVFGQLAYMYV